MTTNQKPVLVVLIEDELIHTDEHPYCSDLTCPCQDDLAATMEQDPEDWQSWQPTYTRADAEGDSANAAYYDEVARRV